MTDLYYSWANYKQSSPEAQEQILTEMDLDNSLPDLPWRQQAIIFNGAPTAIILKYLPELAWESQVYVWKNCLAVGARDEAWPLLKPEAQNKIKPRRGRSLCLA
jgi:hypothetical protein